MQNSIFITAENGKESKPLPSWSHHSNKSQTFGSRLYMSGPLFIAYKNRVQFTLLTGLLTSHNSSFISKDPNCSLSNFNQVYFGKHLRSLSDAALVGILFGPKWQKPNLSSLKPRGTFTEERMNKKLWLDLQTAGTRNSIALPLKAVPGGQLYVAWKCGFLHVADSIPARGFYDSLTLS